jgi:acyl transferase domain-containing protein
MKAGWESKTFYHPAMTTNDRIYCRRGGFLGSLARFSPAAYGVMPTAIGGEPDHFLALQVADEALADAGFENGSLDGKRVEVILGKGTYINSGYTNLLQHGFIVDQTVELLGQVNPSLQDDELESIRAALKASLPPFTADTVPAMVPNLVAGRIANRLDLMGASYTVDAACASSLVAVQQGIRDLRSGTCDVVLAGGVHASTPPQILMLFCQLGALSRTEQIRPFDAAADGTLLGEGVGIIVLKRAEDAERDGHSIYALIKEVETASDGKAVGLLAPRCEGEELAIRRTYERAAISPTSVELIEAHGTGTIVGDLTEIQALTRVFGERKSTFPTCGIGSVKSMISHLLPAAGIASIIKVALALEHKALPPTINCEEPSPKLELHRTPFYMNTKLRPWIHGASTPRRAGVNAFGFGGINAHALLEEYVGERAGRRPMLWPKWETELFVLQGNSNEELVRKCILLESAARTVTDEQLPELAFTSNCAEEWSALRCAIVAKDVGDLIQKLESARLSLTSRWPNATRGQKGVYVTEQPLAMEGKVGFVFPGEGSQYVGMLSDLCLQFDEVRECFDRSDRVFELNQCEIRPSQLLFPPTHASLSPDVKVEERLWQMDVAAEAVFTADHALFGLVSHLKIFPDAVVGHSSGEFAALLASGALVLKDPDDLVVHSAKLNQLFTSLAHQVPTSSLATVGCADPSWIRDAISEAAGTIQIALDNCPHQVVLSGPQEAITAACRRLQTQGAICSFLPFSRGYHTLHFAPVADQLARFFEMLEITIPRVPLYSCKTARAFPTDPAAIRSLACDQWSAPVRFREVIETMYNDGVRIFVEVGPKANLTAFIRDILEKRHHIAVPLNTVRNSGLTQLNNALGMLAAHGVQMRLEYLYSHRTKRRRSLDEITSVKSKKCPSEHDVQLSGELPRLKLPPEYTIQHRFDPLIASSGPRSKTPIESVLLSPQPGRVSERFRVLKQHFGNLEKIVSTEENVMRAFLSERRPQQSRPLNVRVTNEYDRARKLPFPITIEHLRPQRELQGSSNLSLEEDIFLLDHVIGRSPHRNGLNPGGLPVLPLTISLEIMAEAATLLASKKHLVRIQNVRAHRWIEVPNKTRSFAISASCSSDSTEDRVEVVIRELSDAALEKQDSLIEGVVVFGDAYPSPPQSRPSRGKEIRFRHGPEEYYQIMFHGPLFRTVVSVDRLEDTGAEATLQIPTTHHVFRSHSGEGMLTSPILLDGAGQVIGFWAWDRFEEGFTVFPVGFESMELFGPLPTNSDRIKCHAEIRTLNDGQVSSDLRLCAPDGAVLTKISGWKDKRLFDWSRPFARFVLSPTERTFTRSCPGIVSGLCGGAEMVCRGVFERGTGIWSRILARLILNVAEQEFWMGLRGPEKYRRQWLLGRMAAKDAVRTYAAEKLNLHLNLSDIEIDAPSDGHPCITNSLQSAGLRVRLAIAQGSDCAIAAVADEGKCRGLSIEIDDRPSLSELESDLDTADSCLVHDLPVLERTQWARRIHCAKRALAKLMSRQVHCTVSRVERPTGIVFACVRDAPITQPFDLPVQTFPVITGVMENLVFASVAT